ncbi:hypothetical protein BS78_K302500 [Paspalum vaginatum]|uniref:Uncharacterized protein n=1 Tax=Paspalum vaginatum TaxID=158149 RepID=A0A9W7X7Y8_9POAL|nr:hypothetical protein BS78_K302500 [Paspalum vaginatum]
MPQPLHGDEAAGQNPAFTCPRFLISSLLEIALAILVITLPWYYILYDLPPEFSVQLQPICRAGLTNTSSSAPAETAFDAALHASNRRATERCYRHGEGLVAYGGFTVAAGTVPGFCVPGKGRRDVQLLLPRKDGVGLPERLRDRMAAANKVGALELEVQVRLFQNGDAASGRPTRMWCKARVGGARQPPEVALCNVFALQNWFDVDA